MIRSAMVCVIGACMVAPVVADQACSRSLHALRCRSVTMEALPSGMYAMIDLHDAQIKKPVRNLAAGHLMASKVAFHDKVELLSTQADLSYVTFDRDAVITAISDSFKQAVFLKNVTLNADQVVLDQTKVHGNVTLQSVEHDKPVSLRLVGNSEIQGDIVFKGKKKGYVCMQIGSIVAGKLINGDYRCAAKAHQS